ncbi:helix-turn-helix domain-containing protein [archaeon]|jgi:DNA-binding IclR family transcriptional regulator|nr:helix-turn-helix domain-containing protein [archaeon]MBT4352883.1 helix-turn-helix domain-containing protein [archaeon]MBT4647434.1 helix-turn-helix domain-containing protein [archaeon]MBT6821288.1 helix-turn-helix domain-containing protein [archaeon]MBT7391359.1 helix-turn-helix domain-containing protein [archaeon]
MSTHFDGLVDKKTLKVLKVFLNNEKEYYHITQISKLTKVPLATTFRIIHSLHKNLFLEQKTISKLKIYKLKQNRKTKFFKKNI